MDKAAAKQHLAEVDKHIAEALARITRQQQIIGECSAAGHSTQQAKELLDTLMDKHKALLLMRQQTLSELSELGDEQA